MDRIRIIPPGPGKCRICAAKHDAQEPHDRNSLYYQNWFYKKHRRFPTWEDAMASCPDDVKAEWREKLGLGGEDG